jgi:glutaredoxin 3
MKQIAQIKMLKKNPCPYCDRAMNFFKAKGVEVEIVDLTDRLDELQQWKQKTGWQTVPMIFINEKLIGGYSDIKALDDEGKFDSLVFG